MQADRKWRLRRYGLAHRASVLAMKKILLPDHSIHSLFGPQDENMKLMESLFNITIHLRGANLTIEGEEQDVALTEKILMDFSSLLRQGRQFSNGDFRSALQQIAADSALSLKDFFPKLQICLLGGRCVFPKSANQRHYLEAMLSNDIVFAIGPGGTGKTYLAVTMAIHYLVEKVVTRIILTRPAVEAGEKLGFLPGGINEKIDPYLRPLYDALYHLMEGEKVNRFIEKNIIEIAPLAYMRGRTLNDSFIILDEAQNTTSEQMKMFLTRIGYNSRAVITGDITQIDLPPGRCSGLVEAKQVLAKVPELSFCCFNENDVVRHRLVRLIIKAYESNYSLNPSNHNVPKTTN